MQITWLQTKKDDTTPMFKPLSTNYLSRMSFQIFVGSLWDAGDHTSHCVSWCCLAPPPGLITDPLLTAAAGDFNSLWVLAPNPGGLRLITQRDTSDHPIHTQTLVFAIGLEALAIVKDHTIVLTASALQIWIATKSRTSAVKFIKHIQYQEKCVMCCAVLRGKQNVL